MAKKTEAEGATRSKKRKVRTTDDDRVVVGSEVGVSLPIGDTFAHIRFSFWSERYAKNSTRAEIRKTAEEVDEFNERELERRLGKHVKMVKNALREIESDDDEEDEGEPRRLSNKVSVRDRAKARMK